MKKDFINASPDNTPESPVKLAITTDPNLTFAERKTELKVESRDGAESETIRITQTPMPYNILSIPFIHLDTAESCLNTLQNSNGTLVLSCHYSEIEKNDPESYDSLYGSGWGNNKANELIVCDPFNVITSFKIKAKGGAFKEEYTGYKVDLPCPVWKPASVFYDNLVGSLGVHGSWYELYLNEYKVLMCSILA